MSPRSGFSTGVRINLSVSDGFRWRTGDSTSAYVRI